jgi:hypothetical protein
LLLASAYEQCVLPVNAWLIPGFCPGGDYYPFFLAGLAGGAARCMYAKPLESWKKRVSGVNSEHFMIDI